MAGLEQPNTNNLKSSISEVGPDGLPNIIEINSEVSKDGALRAVCKQKDGMWLLLVTRPPYGKWSGYTGVPVRRDEKGKPIAGKPITPAQAREFYQYAQDPKNINLPTWAISE